MVIYWICTNCEFQGVGLGARDFHAMNCDGFLIQLGIQFQHIPGYAFNRRAGQKYKEECHIGIALFEVNLKEKSI